jgi:hypothetical protein
MNRDREVALWSPRHCNFAVSRKPWRHLVWNPTEPVILCSDITAQCQGAYIGLVVGLGWSEVG